MGLVEHVTVFDPDGRKDYSFDHRIEVLLTVNTATGEEQFELTKNVGHNVAGDPCADALRFSNA
jgi:hypothetical protein